MLWAYFDESGEHDASGALRALTIGGLVAPFEAWQQFEKEWRGALRSEGLSTFHRRELGPGRDKRFLKSSPLMPPMHSASASELASPLALSEVPVQLLTSRRATPSPTGQLQSQPQSP